LEAAATSQLRKPLSTVVDQGVLPDLRDGLRGLQSARAEVQIASDAMRQSILAASEEFHPLYEANYLLSSSSRSAQYVCREFAPNFTFADYLTAEFLGNSNDG
jgi:hypothetical protein